MNLDDLEYFKRIDKENMLSEIDRLPDQLAAAFGHGLTQDLPSGWEIQRVVISGMGGSAIGADLLSAYVQQTCTIPVLVHRDYGLPAYATGNETLVIASSHSGNTEETLDAFETGLQNQCRIVAVSTGGELAKRAQKTNTPLWTFMHKGQPRAAVGFSFGLLLAMFARLGFIPDPANDLADAVQTMRSFQQHLRPDVPAVNNPAKRYAGQLMGRWVTVMGAGLLAPVARRWKGQINEVAKAGANFEFLPEADHNALAGTLHPEEVLNPHMMTLFLRAPSDHPRNRLRSDLTRKTYMLEGLNTDVIDARGKSPLAHMWSLITFGDFMAYYLAMAYGVDPTPVEALVNLKKSMLEVH
ncbi:MAG: bifunctional phosphoglucose/phosphomannose isomerase [Chloroflexi bacterium RBG_16_51_16]|nr:MAG: bifunctional phosphoglucose/phosphomannose isomerase [Chloroflexi bacterium RBG_16_51_16]